MFNTLYQLLSRAHLNKYKAYCTFCHKNIRATQKNPYYFKFIR